MPGFGDNADKYSYQPGMIITGQIRKSLLISLAGHIAVFSIIGFSFGVKMPTLGFRGVNFWGRVLLNSDLSNAPGPGIGKLKILREKDAGRILEYAGKEYFLSQGIYLKPQAGLMLNEDKLTFQGLPFAGLAGLKAKEPVIMFYPRLPYGASLYFKDRQVVHIELAFNIATSAKYNSIAVKRVISSGNLEVDLLSARYISRYLFIQRRGFNPDNWHTVKIDLSTP